MKKAKNTKKSTPVNWGNLANSLEQKSGLEQKPSNVDDDWETAADTSATTPIITKVIPKKEVNDSWENDTEPVIKEIPKGTSSETKPSTPSYTMEQLQNLSWEDKQEFLLKIEEEEAKKSEFYCENFEKMELDDRVLHGVYSYGFDKPSIVQSRAIKAVKTRQDCIVQAQSGTGKTATFSIGTLSNIDFEIKSCQAIILAPTRELADQIHKVISALAHYTGAKISLCVGKMRLDDNIKQSQIVVGTTGRVFDCINRGSIDVSKIRMLVMDEADEMLSEGFKVQVYEIFQKLPDDIQVCLFSATLSPEVIEVSNNFMEEPLKILIKQEFVTLKGISQFYVNCIKDEYKLEILLDVYKRYMYSQSIVYVNSKNKCCWLASELIRRNHTVLYIDSSMQQKERSRIMREFRNGTCRILITTNLLSRGIDIQGVNLVINYDLPNPNNIESYVHRIGRCGRYGRKGVAINFITPNDFYIIQNIRRYYSTTIEELPENLTALMTYS